jgi:hypothetical protein
VRGDYNGDALAEAADYPVWRETVGSTGNGLAADVAGLDGMPDGVVDQVDYLCWKANFGLSAPWAGNPEAGSLAVPEPATSVIAFVAQLALGKRRMRTGEVV